MNSREREQYIEDSKKHLTEWIQKRDAYKEHFENANTQIAYYNAVIEALINLDTTSVGEETKIFKARVFKWTKPTLDAIKNNKKLLKAIDILYIIRPDSEKLTEFGKQRSLDDIENVLTKMIRNNKIKRYIKDGDAYYGLPSWFEDKIPSKEYLQTIQ